MFFIMAGEVEADVQPVPRRLGRGQFFGEIALLRDTVRTATVATVTECELLTLDVADFRRLLDAHPDLALSIARVAEERLGPGARSDRPLLLRLELALVLPDEGPDLVGHLEDPEPLLLVERDREPAEPVDGHPALLAHPELAALPGPGPEGLVLGPQPGQLGFGLLVGHDARLLGVSRPIQRDTRGARDQRVAPPRPSRGLTGVP
jgi:hypothetical protein